MVISAFDANQDVRHWGKRTVAFLQLHPQFRQICHKHLSESSATKIFELLKSKNLQQKFRPIERETERQRDRNSPDSSLKSSISIIGKKMYSTF